MKLVASLFALSAASVVTAHTSHGQTNARHKAYLERRDKVLGRQAAPAAVVAAVSSAPSAAPSVAPSSTLTVSAPAATGSVSVSAGVVSGAGSSSVTASASAPVITTPTVPGTEIPPLAQITAGAPIETPLSMFTTFAAGATPPLSGAPALPTLTTFNPALYPALDQIPPIDSPEVQQWLSEIDLSNVPNLNLTVDGSCASDPAFAADQSRCWWTCGGCTRPTDITTCPTKLDWGVSYDDGPSPYTPKLVDYLYEKNITATFYVVGSRVISRPQMLQTEYMLGHEISDHTWSHPPLTTLTNEQIVAELAWTKKAIKDILGVTPRYMRPPYGDIDDRVRAVVAAMGLIPVLWSGSGDDLFDTDDWKIAGGTANGTSSFAAWEKIADSAINLSTGFVVLAHDLYQQSVDMAVGYILPDALSHQPPFALKSVIECQHQPPSSTYLELYVNSTTGANSTAAGGTAAGGASGAQTDATKKSGSSPLSGSVRGSMTLGLIGAAVGMVLAVS